MKRARRQSLGPPTPVSNRAHIVALEERIQELERVIEQHARDLAVQLQRIGQLQADLDTIRAAWSDTKRPRRPS